MITNETKVLDLFYNGVKSVDIAKKTGVNISEISRVISAHLADVKTDSLENRLLQIRAIEQRLFDVMEERAKMTNADKRANSLDREIDNLTIIYSHFRVLTKN